MRAPILLIVGADARPASAAAPRVHANALLQRDLRGAVGPVGGVSADAEGLSVLFSVVIQALYKPSCINTNLLRQIALIDQQTAQIATGRQRNSTNKKARTCRASGAMENLSSKAPPWVPARKPLKAATSDAALRQQVQDESPAEARTLVGARSSRNAPPAVATNPSPKTAASAALRMRIEWDVRYMVFSFVALRSVCVVTNCRESARTMRSECDEVRKWWSELQARGTAGVNRPLVRRNVQRGSRPVRPSPFAAEFLL